MAGFLIAQINMTICSFTTTHQINLQLKIEVPVFKDAKSTIHMYRTDMAFNEFTGHSDITRVQGHHLWKIHLVHTI
jgi:hypothetical protein